MRDDGEIFYNLSINGKIQTVYVHSLRIQKVTN